MQANLLAAWAVNTVKATAGVAETADASDLKSEGTKVP
jgi:hypothetical protein